MAFEMGHSYRCLEKVESGLGISALSLHLAEF